MKKFIQSHTKRITSFLLLVVMLAAWVPCTQAADSGLILDMDLSGYDGTAASIVNKAEASDAVLELGGTPTKGTISNITGETTDYLQFGVVPEGATKGFSGTTQTNCIKLTSSALNTAKQGTVSFWMYQDVSMVDYAWAGNIYFKYAPTGAPSSLLALQPGYGSNSRLTLSGTANDTALANAKETWYLTTITWTYDEGTNTWTARVYKNGASEQTVSKAVTYDISAGIVQIGYGFPGKMSQIRVYDKALPAAEILAMYQAEADLYLEGASDIVLESINPVAGDLSSNAGEITLDFNNYVDSDSISGITFTKADGTPIKGKTLVYLPEAVSKQVKVKYGDLEDGEAYTLTIPEGIASLNGYYTENETIVDYTAASSVFFHEDFEDEEEGLVTGIDGLSATAGNVEGDWTDFMVHVDETTGRKYMDFVSVKKNATTLEASTFLYWHPDASVGNSEVAIEVKFRNSQRGKDTAGRAGSERKLFGLYFGGNTSSSFRIFDAASDGGATYQSNTGDVCSTVADEEGWHNMKLVTGIDDEGNRYIDYYVDPADPSKAFRTYNNSYTGATGALTRVLLGRNYLYNITDGLGTMGVSFDEIKIYKPSEPIVICTENADASEVIYFGSDMNVESLENAEFYFMSEKGKRIDAAFVDYNADDRAATVVPSDYFLYDETYKLYIKGAITEKGEMLSSGAAYEFTMPSYVVTAAEPVFKDAVSGAAVATLSDADSINADLTIFNADSVPHPMAVIALHYDGEGRLKSAVKESVSAIENDETPVTVNISNQAFAANDSVKLLVWDEFDGVAKPLLLEPVILPFAAVQ